MRKTAELSAERSEYIKFLKFLDKTNKDKQNAEQLIKNFSHDGIQKICRCFYNIIHSKDLDSICYKKNKVNAEKLAKLINKHKKDIKLLTRHSVKRKDLENKRQIIHGRGILTALSLAIPGLLALLSK